MKFRHEALAAFARELLQRAGMPQDKSEDVAQVLVEGELLGRSTHGYALLAPYLREIQSGGMQVDGAPRVVNDFGACLTWDGRKLPGPWLMLRAVDEAMARAGQFGMGAVSIQRSHHAACLGAYLRRATDQGLMLYIALTDPGFSSVAPFGGITPVLTSNPIAFGAPGGDKPVHIDISTSMTTNGMVARMQSQGRHFDQPWLLDNQGHASTDPAVVGATPPGTVLPLGGLDAGHKGYGIGLMVELLSGCLSGHGRAEPKEGWSASVFVLALDPAAFGGTDAYLKQATWLADACRASAPRPGVAKVSVPGDDSEARRQRQLRDGVQVDPGVMAALKPWSERLSVPMPT
ncbi:Ldh family oxidoreductase [Variovorax rhizosphaerae]|uniref:Ldh family oxidoreductase n=1 Tax=Variovorax rhizosphaerae TaxID=1836200 RepID=A0ABU8WDH8_9BURK